MEPAEGTEKLPVRTKLAFGVGASAEAAMSAGNALIGELADGHSGEDLWGHPRWYQRRLHDLLEENTPG